jgi:hypothetical protein
MSNKRDVWTLTVGHYKGEHFATFPPALITPCIRAGSRLGDIIFDPFAGSGCYAVDLLSFHGDDAAGSLYLSPRYCAIEQPS